MATFKITLHIRKAPKEDPVFFKVDGNRFESEKTVKLNVNQQYRLDFSFKPDKELENLTIHGGKLSYEKRTRRESGDVSYSAQWTTCGISQNHKGKRHHVPMMLTLKDFGNVKLVLQCKFYPEAEYQHSHWGGAANYMEYECKVNEAGNINIVKETFR